VRSVARALGWTALAVAVALGVWVAVTLVWGDPITSAYTTREQHALAGQLRHEPASARARRDGSAFGRIVVPRLHLSMVVVEGTSTADLRKGPGHYRLTSRPGGGGTVAIAGHRTTWLHPFRHIDKLCPGDEIRLQMPYGTFVYRVTGHRIVAANDWSIIRRRPWEQLVLSACHPLYSASHRWVVFAALARGT
jgi:sortase A